jgi:hypothetical protein
MGQMMGVSERRPILVISESTAINGRTLHVMKWNVVTGQFAHFGSVVEFGRNC